MSITTSSARSSTAAASRRAEADEARLKLLPEDHYPPPPAGLTVAPRPVKAAVRAWQASDRDVDIRYGRARKVKPHTYFELPNGNVLVFGYARRPETTNQPQNFAVLLDPAGRELWRGTEHVGAALLGDDRLAVFGRGRESDTLYPMTLMTLSGHEVMTHVAVSADAAPERVGERFVVRTGYGDEHSVYDIGTGAFVSSL